MFIKLVLILNLQIEREREKNCYKKGKRKSIIEGVKGKRKVKGKEEDHQEPSNLSKTATESATSF